MSSPAQTGNFMPPSVVQAWQNRALTCAVPLTVAALAGWALAWLRGDNEFYRAYLLGYMWVLGLSLGSLALLMVYHTTGGAWGTVLRRPLEAAMRTIWVVAIGFVPILLGLHRLYPWARPEEVARRPELQRLASLYLTPRLFTLRAVLYFIAWIALAVWMARASARQDRENVVLDKPLRAVGGAGLVVYALTLTFATVDWVMSLSAPWSSTIYGLLYMVGQGMIALSLAVVVLAGLVRRPPMQGLVQADQFLDHGKLLLTFTMLWGWFTLSQWLIIWAGNLPDEISWYLDRSSPGWHAFSWCVVLGQFFVPFFLLLSRDFKKDPRKLQKLALYIILVRYWDLFWYIVPGFENRKQHWGYSWQYAVAPLAMLCWWLVLYFHNLGHRPLLAVQDDHVKLILEEAAGDAYEHERA
jgi:hypothetical protein